MQQLEKGLEQVKNKKERKKTYTHQTHAGTHPTQPIVKSYLIKRNYAIFNNQCGIKYRPM